MKYILSITILFCLFSCSTTKPAEHISSPHEGGFENAPAHLFFRTNGKTINLLVKDSICKPLDLGNYITTDVPLRYGDLPLQKWGENKLPADSSVWHENKMPVRQWGDIGDLSGIPGTNILCSNCKYYGGTYHYHRSKHFNYSYGTASFDSSLYYDIYPFELQTDGGDIGRFHISTDSLRFEESAPLEAAFLQPGQTFSISIDGITQFVEYRWDFNGLDVLKIQEYNYRKNKLLIQL